MTANDCAIESTLSLHSNSHSNENGNIILPSYDFDEEWHSHQNTSSTSSSQHLPPHYATSTSSSQSLLSDPLKPIGALLASSSYYQPLSQFIQLPIVSQTHGFYSDASPKTRPEYQHGSQVYSSTLFSQNPRNTSVYGNSRTPGSFHKPRLPLPIEHGIEISAGFQNYTNPFTARKKQFGTQNEHNKSHLDAYEVEPLSFYKAREHEGASESQFRCRMLECMKSPLGEMSHMDKVFESLDKLIPEMDQDLFQPSELISLAISETSRGMDPHYTHPLPSPQFTQDITSRSIMQNMILNNPEPLGPLPVLVGQRSIKNMAICKVHGCERRVRSKGFCKTHGGGRKCSIDGCNKSSQNGEFCIGHGGGKKCKREGCTKAAQSHGLCKAHGGGARCKFPDCTKSSQGGGLCRAHGGGKRCQAIDCQKGAQRGNFCATHGGFRNCKFDGCVRTDRGGGFCEVHRRGRLCKVKACKKLARNEGMCTMHIRAEKQVLMEG
uniref:Uncharacterized protein AlNc14C30G2816 n=1 Tax=Albugo laibachii Nc14 TaxID=890382 RepID=F0W7L0_9STRA|nr:conserved hypothetical protein [Albugo laibachii Nc14]|eukprot:CCA17111.1 conserved hypothetical protein [Albugo laibachii Nc14]